MSERRRAVRGAAGVRPLWLTLAPVIFLGLWSGGYVVAKIGIEYAPPLTLLALRYAFVVLLMAVLFVILRPPLPKTRADWGHLAVVGLLIQAVYFGFSYLAFRDGVASGTVALIMSLQPILVAIVAPIWTDEHVGWRRWIGLGMGLAGTVIVIVARSVIAVPSPAGLAFCAAALAGMTIATLWEKRFGLSHHPVTASLIGFVAGFAVILPVALWLEDPVVQWTWSFAGALGYLVIGNSLIAISLLLAMIRAGEVSRVSALLFLVPPLAALMAWPVLGEVMPPLAWAGMALAGAGVLIATRAR
ncbi:MAG: DMT family transporter [Pseudomonadota bacterium]